MHYHDSDDLKRLGEFKQLAPREFSAFVEFDKIVGREDGTIPRKYRELIAIAVACTTQCLLPRCAHSRSQTRRRHSRRSQRSCDVSGRASSWSSGHSRCTRGEVVRPSPSVPSSRCRRPEVRSPGLGFSVV